jgi:ankyrin repeat protein
MHACITEPTPNVVLLQAIASKNIKLVNCIISDGIDIFQLSGSEHKTALMQAIMSESLPIIDILIRNGEKAGRFYGLNKMTAYHYAVQEEKWAALAHLVRLEGYPAARAGFHTPLELAKYMAYWRCVSRCFYSGMVARALATHSKSLPLSTHAKSLGQEARIM